MVSGPVRLRALVGGKSVDLPARQVVGSALATTPVEVNGVVRTFAEHISALKGVVSSVGDQVFDFSLETEASVSDDWSN